LNPAALQVLWVDELNRPELLDGLPESAWGPFQFERCTDLSAAAQRLGESPFDALLAALPHERAAGLSAWPALSHAVQHSATLVFTPDCEPDWTLDLLARGVQEVLPQVQLACLPRCLRLSIERHKLDRAARKAYATDLGTGLPNRTQLLEHMNHLLALRQREPSPMGLLVVRVEGLLRAKEDLGREAANVLRRKVAVRLRAGVRASDVVASLGADVFGVLLASTEKPEDTERVARKLQNAVHKPLSVAGHDLTLNSSAGISLYPSDAQDADTLLRLATAAAAGRPAAAKSGLTQWPERSRKAKPAANDEEV